MVEEVHKDVEEAVDDRVRNPCPSTTGVWK